MKKTPLYEKHIQLKGKIIDFGGWGLPVEYSGIIPEHEAVRTKAGIFDVSHMGEITVQGEDSEKYLQMLLTNDISLLNNNQIAYTTMCYPHGGVVDDLLVYKYTNTDYLLVVNASNTEKDYRWMKENIFGDTEVLNVSENYAQVALQGPLSQTILQKLTKKDLNEIEFYYFCDNVNIGNIGALVSRTGYTGEDGFELYFAYDKAEEMWELILETGKEEGLIPAGLGARDTLRFEAALPLYGHELDENITPLEAGLGFCVKLNKENFIGKEALANQKSEGLNRKIIGFEMIDRGIPRNNYEVYAEGRKIGYVTTGSFSPTLKKNIGLALIDSAYSKEGTEIEVLIRNKNLKAKVIKKPFYSKKYKKMP
ncbi:MAG: glycine cleavage system aminomethyltransferase GcvT [Tissierellia bacterium]|jgi:aminomethyltransferase|nr:glycine cleavage system aminomethyltransferase GcvT [Tissierellia bacterium]MDD3226484.1 glycine cleavage system aminomethyltransferase GcvT [Tissierellia bacterium]MDD3750807.1 glycine cleavage system aminomethyltransferase GcvT [Tissierellia bacterium]MDD4045786.1 glycine cleavage system aminomethyltransferase GcvT [Tissierellia bacterium]MDD4678384.1 glycine cleavage system aminomethyltransferase GcvT [Tissierellia bacterium]